MARGNIQRFTVELDMLDPEKIRQTLKRQGVDLAVINPAGPGGGCPVVQLTGTATKLARIARTYGYTELTLNLDRDSVGHAL